MLRSDVWPHTHIYDGISKYQILIVLVDNDMQDAKKDLGVAWRAKRVGNNMYMKELFKCSNMCIDIIISSM